MEADAGAISESNAGNTSNWQRVTYQRSGSPNARGCRMPPVPQSVTPRAPDDVALSTEQVQTINSARAGLTAVELAQVKQRERLVQPVINPVKHGESSRNKGKGIDPREFGSAGIPTEELDPACQAAEYELWHAHQDTTPASIVTSVNSVTVPEPTRASVPPANRVQGRDALLGKARQLREELARLETEIASTNIENSENRTARASKKRPVQSPNLSEEQRRRASRSVRPLDPLVTQNPMMSAIAGMASDMEHRRNSRGPILNRISTINPVRQLPRSSYVGELLDRLSNQEPEAQCDPSGGAPPRKPPSGPPSDDDYSSSGGSSASERARRKRRKYKLRCSKSPKPLVKPLPPPKYNGEAVMGH
ncbi:hypothetical protein OE88DRAFT_1734112 [Heliocybe sulcata]|uniref:Uncharacterized protein n=1 Tax=Heliocybe sulcata TaxID=5364 RepID=A0A5C3N646_9AGAM|nr:hypothetical protein OE88DRAFT_1734112 [Heliocybe sulcata]